MTMVQKNNKLITNILIKNNIYSFFNNNINNINNNKIFNYFKSNNIYSYSNNNLNNNINNINNINEKELDINTLSSEILINKNQIDNNNINNTNNNSNQNNYINEIDLNQNNLDPQEVKNQIIKESQLNFITTFSLKSESNHNVSEGLKTKGGIEMIASIKLINDKFSLQDIIYNMSGQVILDKEIHIIEVTFKWFLEQKLDEEKIYIKKEIKINDLENKEIKIVLHYVEFFYFAKNILNFIPNKDAFISND